MRFKRDRKSKVNATLDMAPMIDVVFQLIIFFMLTSSFVVQTSIPIEIPESKSASENEAKDVSITLVFDQKGPENGGDIIITNNGKETSVTNWDELSSFMVELHANKPDAGVLIRPDKRVPTGRTIQVLGLITSAGIKEHFIQAEQPDGGK